MNVVPVQSVANQTFNVAISGQNATLNIYQKLSGLYMDVLVNDAPIISGVICENLNRIVRSLYLGFVGDFVWLDTQGASNPSYSELGSRYVLVYLTLADLPGGEG